MVLVLPPVHEYVYGEVPPPGVTVALPLEVHSVVLAVTDVLAVTAAGAVIVTLPVPEHPWLSVTVSVYVPAESAEIPAVVLPPVQE